VCARRDDEYHSGIASRYCGSPSSSFTQPIFSFVEGYFSATGAGAAIDKAQKLPGVPPYTPAQVEAVELYRTTVSECAVDIGFEPGDIQFLNNFVTLHTRREYEDWPDDGRKRPQVGGVLDDEKDVHRCTRAATPQAKW